MDKLCHSPNLKSLYCDFRHEISRSASGAIGSPLEHLHIVHECDENEVMESWSHGHPEMLSELEISMVCVCLTFSDYSGFEQCNVGTRRCIYLKASNVRMSSEYSSLNIATSGQHF